VGKSGGENKEKRRKQNKRECSYVAGRVYSLIATLDMSVAFSVKVMCMLLYDPAF
jgi:hypothetical protein